ncbi:peptidase S8/S53 domain-containing protein [Pilobolus umbonatus]|nr:peptidase S8/S53 domain-containing protein [Pilobolus umbonatus]
MSGSTLQSTNVLFAEDNLSLSHICLGSTFSAVTGVFSDHAFLDYLYRQPSVHYVEPVYTYTSTVVPNNQSDLNMHQSSIHEKKHGKTSNWGLARINQRVKGDLDQYEYDTKGGEGIDIFVLDTGVYTDHLDFDGRATHSVNLVKNEDYVDMGGHGTHVSSKIIGSEYGVAKHANVRSVKILNKSGDGTSSSLLKGIEHVMNTATPGKSLVNLSLSGPRSQLIDEAINVLVLEHRIPVFVSAGNAGTDACFFSPSSNPNVFSVGSTDMNDHVPRYSNFGECVSVYAPGSNIVSAYIGGIDSSKSLDGTSMASPHVAGIAASMMALKTFNSPQELYQAIRDLSTKDVLTFDVNRSSVPNNNQLAFNDIN